MKFVFGSSPPRGPSGAAFGQSVQLPKRGPTGYSRSDKKRGAGVKSGLTRAGRAQTSLPKAKQSAAPQGPLGGGGFGRQAAPVRLPDRQRFGGTGGGFLSRFFRRFGK